MPLSKATRLIHAIEHHLNTFSHWLLPQSCFLCGDTSTKPVCMACLADLPYQVSACRRCGKDLKEIGVCSQCQKKPPPYTHVQAIFSYIYPLNKLIPAAKYNQNLAVLNLLGNLMAQHLTIEPCPDVLIPIPLHPKRLRQRGYNQSLELAKCITRHTGIMVNYTSCRRIKNTPPQASLKDATQRQANIQGAFQVLWTKPNWQHIVLIDDVMTTGGTVQELTNEFLKAGIQRIDVWCCART